MLQNAYFLAKIGADTAENEQHFAEILPKTGGRRPSRGAAGCRAARRDRRGRRRGPGNERVRPAATTYVCKISKISNFSFLFFANFFQNFAIFWRARSRLYQNEILARKYAFDSIFQALQDLHPFAPLQSQKFRKKKIGLKNQQF